MDETATPKMEARRSIAAANDIDRETFESMKPYFVDAKLTTFMADYNAFVKRFPIEAQRISANRPAQVGPGELVFSFVFNNIDIGINKKIDLYLDGEEFAEVKAGTGKGPCVKDFEISQGSDPAVAELIQFIDDFNASYQDTHGAPLPGYTKSGEVPTRTLETWKVLDTSMSQVGKPIHLSLRCNGDLVRLGDSTPIVNVTKDDSLAPIKHLLTEGEGNRISLAGAIDRWADSVAQNYMGDKRFVLINSGNLEAKYFGKIDRSMIRLHRITRARPKAGVYLEPKSKDEVRTAK
jgi:hypothetical protein